MTIAAAQAQKFYQQVTADQHVFTFLADDSYLVFKVGDAEVVPFWSSRSRLDRVQTLHPKYRNYMVDEISLDQFLTKTLSQFREEQIRVGVNWSGRRLTGYDLTADDLERNLKYWLAKASG